MPKKSQKERIAELHGQLADKCKEIESLRRARRHAAREWARFIVAARKAGVDEPLARHAEGEVLALESV
jgi:multidrug resistance efflux pump